MCVREREGRGERERRRDLLVYRNNLSKLALGELKGNQLHTGVSQRFPMRADKLPGGIQYDSVQFSTNRTTQCCSVSNFMQILIKWDQQDVSLPAHHNLEISFFVLRLHINSVHITRTLGSRQSVSIMYALRPIYISTS